MNEVIILSGALVASGLYITYLLSQLNRYRKVLALATMAMESAYVQILDQKAVLAAVEDEE